MFRTILRIGRKIFNKSQPLSESRRKEVFRGLVDVQDEGHLVDDSRIIVATRFGITLADVETIEEEGIAGEWPIH